MRVREKKSFWISIVFCYSYSSANPFQRRREVFPDGIRFDPAQPGGATQQQIGIYSHVGKNVKSAIASCLTALRKTRKRYRATLACVPLMR